MLSTEKWATSKSTQLSTKVWVKVLLLLENALKLNFEDLYLTENLNPLQRPTHTLTSSSINTHNRSKNYVWIYHGMHCTLHYRQKLSIILKSKDLATRGFQKKFQTHPPKPAEVKPSFRKVTLPPEKLSMPFPAHLWVREFWPQIYSL